MKDSTIHRIYNYCVTSAIVVCLFILNSLLSGCMTSYDIRVCHEDAAVCSEVHVKSFREFKNPQIAYQRETGKIIFNFGAEAATTAVSPVEQAVADVIRAAPAVILPAPGVPQ